MNETTTQMPGTVGATGFAEPQRSSSPGEEIRQEAQSLKATATEAVRDAGEQIRNTAQDAAQRVKQESVGMAEGQKTKAADQLGAFGAAIRSAADRLHNENDHRIAEYAEAAAQRVDDAARYLKDHNFSGIVGDLETFARRQPELFLGGMFLAGMGLSRFLKASRPEPQPSSRSTSSRLGDMPQSAEF